ISLSRLLWFFKQAAPLVVADSFNVYSGCGCHSTDSEFRHNKFLLIPYYDTELTLGMKLYVETISSIQWQWFSSCRDMFRRGSIHLLRCTSAAALARYQWRMD